MQLGEPTKLPGPLTIDAVAVCGPAPIVPPIALTVIVSTWFVPTGLFAVAGEIRTFASTQASCAEADPEPSLVLVNVAVLLYTPQFAVEVVAATCTEISAPPPGLRAAGQHLAARSTGDVQSGLSPLSDHVTVPTVPPGRVSLIAAPVAVPGPLLCNVTMKPIGRRRSPGLLISRLGQLHVGALTRLRRGGVTRAVVGGGESGVLS